MEFRIGFLRVNRVLLMQKFLISFLMAMALVFSAGAQPQKKFTFPAGTGASSYAPGLVWVKVAEENRDFFQSGEGRKTASRLRAQTIQPLVPFQTLEKNQGRIAPRKPHVDISLYYQITFDKTRPLEEFINELLAFAKFEKVEPVTLETPLLTPDDASLSAQYYLEVIQAYSAWDITQGSESMVIGIVDTGGDLDHPDLQDKLYINEADPVDCLDNDNDGYVDNYRGWDFSSDDVNNINTPGFTGDNDPSILKGNMFGHGTRVAGCAAASTNNGIGIAGVGYQTKLLFTKHYADNQPDNSTLYSSNLYLGVLYAATHGAKIINCSWGGTTASSINQDIMTYVTLDLGCLVVAAAGNSNTTTPFYPASYDYVLSVAASDENDVRYAFTSFGPTVDISAPGVNIYSSMYNDTYASQSGTSFSAPIVAGAAALVWSHFPSLDPLQIAEKLRATADASFYASNPDFTNQLGKGRLDIYRALTLTTPSLRASHPVLITENDAMPQPGESANLFLDFTNYLSPSSSALTVTLSTTSPYVSIFQDELVLGAMEELSTMRNTQQPFEIVLSQSIPMNMPLEFLLTFQDGEYSDFQIIQIQLPLYLDINENNVTTSITSIGRLGYSDTQNQSGGSGFVFGGKNILYEMGLIMGTSAADLYNNVRSVNNGYDQDFTPATGILQITPGERSSSEIYGSFRNSVDLGSESLNVSYRSLVWQKEAGSPYNNFIILEYRIRNTTAFDVSGFYFGIFADWDIAQSGGADRADWNAETKLGYVFPADDATLPYAGIQLLLGSPKYYAIDNDPALVGNPLGIYDGFTDEEKFMSLSSFTKTQAGNSAIGNDVSHVVSSGPYTIPAGNEIVVAFALHGATTYADLITSSNYADSLYNYTLQAPIPYTEAVQTCIGSAATLTAEGASHFNWYTHFTGGEPVASGTQFTTGELFSDTTFYVSNADHSFGSVRAPASVSLNPNPIADFSFAGELFSGEPISFTDQSSGAIAWEWAFGDGTTSTEQNPQHFFDAGGNFMVSLTALSEKGCADETVKMLPIITGLERETESDLRIYPNPAVESLTISLPEKISGKSEIKVLTLQGQSVKNINLELTGGSITVGVSDLRKGVYLVKITDAYRSFYRKIIILR